MIAADPVMPALDKTKDRKNKRYHTKMVFDRLAGKNRKQL